MERRTQVILALLVVAVLAVAGGVWRRLQPTTATDAAPTVARYRVLTSGMVEAAAEHRAVIADAMLVPKEMDAAQAQSRAAQPPPILQPTPAAPDAEMPPQGALADVPPSQQVLIGFSGGVVGETDPCG